MRSAGTTPIPARSSGVMESVAFGFPAPGQDAQEPWYTVHIWAVKGEDSYRQGPESLPL